MAYLSDGTLAVLSMTSRTMQPVVRQRILEHTRRWTKMTTTTEKSSVRVKQTGPASTGRIHRGWKVVTNLRECQRRENDHTCGPFRTCGPRPLTIWTHPWIHLHPLLDHRPKQVPPNRWLLRDAKPNKHFMVRVSGCMVVVQLSKTCFKALSNTSFAMATVENMHQ